MEPPARVGLTVSGTWKLEELLGAGGMAAVYRAHGTDGHHAALKILHTEMSARPDVRERFLKEAYVSNRVDHPGAIRVLGHGRDLIGGVEHAYLVLELLTGESLGHYAARHGTLPLALALDTLEQALEVVALGHEQGIVHRDLKPENLFLTSDGRLKVLDFGLARTLVDTPGDFKTRPGVALGTLPYMAPEQALGRRDDIDGRTDIFALGATFFRLLSGQHVHRADSDAELLAAMASKPAASLATIVPDLPRDVCAVLDLALAFAQSARYPDARVMLDDVRALRRGAPPPYARERLRAREEPTQADQESPAAPSAAPESGRGVRTRQFGTAPPVSGRGTERLPRRHAPAPGASPAASERALPERAEAPKASALRARPSARVALGLLIALSALTLGAGAWFTWKLLGGAP